MKGCEFDLVISFKALGWFWVAKLFILIKIPGKVSNWLWDPELLKNILVVCQQNKVLLFIC